VFNDLDVDMHYRLLDKGYILKPIKNLAGQHKQRHNLQAFYRRMKGFGAAGLIISLLNFKNAFSSSYKNKKGVLEYNILALFIASFVLLTAIAAYFSIKTAFLIMISTFLVVFLISSIIAIARIGSAKANMFYFPGVLVYVMVKWLAILHGVFFGAFYYFNNNSKLGALNENS